MELGRKRVYVFVFNLILNFNLCSCYILLSSLWGNLSTLVGTSGRYKMLSNTHTDTVWAGRAIEILMRALSPP